MAAGVLGTMLAGGYGMHGGSGWWMGGMMIWMALFWVLVVAGIAWIVRVSVERRPRMAEDALGILDRRFAEGGVSFEEYSERRATLKGEPINASNQTDPGTEGEWS